MISRVTSSTTWENLPPSAADTHENWTRPSSRPRYSRNRFRVADFLLSDVVSRKVMAIPWMTAGHQHPVDSVLKGLEDEERINPSGARHPNHTDIRRVLNP